jgi:hypothetical protein
LGETYSFADLQDDLYKSPDDSLIIHFFICIAMCNLAIPDNEEFIAISADDKILAEMAALFGFRILSRDEDSCVLLINDEEVFFMFWELRPFHQIKKHLE